MTEYYLEDLTDVKNSSMALPQSLKHAQHYGKANESKFWRISPRSICL
jgi:hypothetical protein